MLQFVAAEARDDWQAMMGQVLSEGQIYTGESIFKRSSGELPVSVVVQAHRNEEGVIEFYSVSARDISDRKQREAELAKLAAHDPLTGLCNRASLSDRLQALLSQASRQQFKVAVLFFDLDEFKSINDRLGHAAGDTLLMAVAERLRHAVRPSDVVARYGGDEFVVIIGNLESVNVVRAVLSKLKTLFSQPVQVQGQSLLIRFSIGVSVFPDHGLSSQELLCHADSAMYETKRARKGRVRIHSQAQALAQAAEQDWLPSKEQLM